MPRRLAIAALLLLLAPAARGEQPWSERRAEPNLRAEAPRPAAPQPGPSSAYEDEPDPSPEQERIEIPAFLRRQAN